MEKYSFLYDYEPSDEQLKDLMHDVIVSVKERAEKADNKYQNLLKSQIADALFLDSGISDGNH